ncbi:MAG: TatD family hydrolase [Bacteroidota bacterium]|nr:TatD family hydrolase [Bacteroidota bacterium]MDP3144728.1 TatD family hydrolase [Bacteroidota bacterium]MDP3557895.1 TatD family hydrolase [Bacteroidota bacterium]
MITDTHTHLYASEFDGDRTALIQKAINNGISKFYLPNIDSTSIDGLHKLEKEFPENCFAMMGLHPCSVNATVKEELAIVRSWLEKRKYSAIGEIGIDLYWDKTFLKEQLHAFELQIKWALEYNYPIVIHCRDAFDEIYEILISFKKLPKAIFHCFSGNLEQANKIIALDNFKLGIGGVLTFKNSGLDKVVEQIDLKHLVLETDAPYLAPVPFRGKRNEPTHLLEVAKKLSEIKNVSINDVATITSKNAQFIFMD